MLVARRHLCTVGEACLWAAGSVAGVIVTGSLYSYEREVSPISSDNTCKTAVTVPGG